MNERHFLRARLFVTSLVAVGIWALLAWEHTHGGVASHHLLDRADMPAVSNWWGGLLLPVLTWSLLGRIHRRGERSTSDPVGGPKPRPRVLGGFAAALLYGVLLSAFFTLDYSAVTEYMFQSLLLLALVFPIYRAEYVLGFVLGMTFTFGAVLPTLVGSVVAGIAALLYVYVRPLVVRVASRLVGARVSAAG